MTTVGELAALVDGVVEGDGGLEISGFNDLDGSGPQDITFLGHSALATRLEQCRAAALITSPDLAKKVSPPDGLSIILVDNPYLAATKIQNFLLAEPFIAAGVHDGAVIGEACVVPREVSIAPGAVLGRGVRLGSRVSLAAGVVVGDDTTIGDDVVIHPNVTIYPRCVIGDRVIVHGGTVIGSDGFGYATDKQGHHHKRPHLGTVCIENDVEIGANCCIDRGTFGETLIRAGTKIDNLVQIGHNVVVGENSLLVAQVGIAGSTVTDRQLVMGGQSALAGHLKIGAGVMVAAKSGVHNNQEAGAVVAGIPAINHKKWLRTSAVMGKLPDLFREVRELRRQVAALTSGESSNLQPDKESGDE